MEQQLYVKYVGKEDDDSIIPFSDLGESLIGFDQSFRKLSKILRINCEVELRAQATTEGSYIVESLLQVAGNAADLFKDVQSFLEFAELCGKEFYQESVQYFNQIENIHKSLNDYFSERPFDLALIAGCITYLLNFLGKIGKERKSLTDEEVLAKFREEISERVTRELLNLLKQKTVARAIKPLIEETAKSIEIDTTRTFPNPLKFDESNYQDYLTEDDQILPQYENGQTYPFDGEITSIKSTRGDSMTFHTDIDGKLYNLELYPKDGMTTKAYLEYYQENAHILAMVLRDSLYKKPKLRIYHIEMNQKKLGFMHDDQESDSNTKD